MSETLCVPKITSNPKVLTQTSQTTELTVYGCEYDNVSLKPVSKRLLLRSSDSLWAIKLPVKVPVKVLNEEMTVGDIAVQINYKGNKVDTAPILLYSEKYVKNYYSGLNETLHKVAQTTQSVVPKLDQQVLDTAGKSTLLAPEWLVTHANKLALGFMVVVVVFGFLIRNAKIHR